MDQLLVSNSSSSIDTTNSAPTNNNWVLRFNALKKLYKLITTFYAERGFSTTNFQALQDNQQLPSLTAIAKDESVADIVKLVQLVIVLCCVVQSEKNELYVQRIQTLDQSVQHALMLAINQVSTFYPSSS